MADPNEETKVDFQASFARDFFADDESKMQVELAAATHVGKVRDRNEDHYAVLRRTRSREMLLTNLANGHQYSDEYAYLMLVADGIAGNQFGDLASELALETMLDAESLATSWIMKFKDLDAQQARERVAAYVERIQETLLRYGMSDPDKSKMGTTLTGAYLMPPHVIIAQIGDSRAYLFRGGVLTQITRDQTLAQALVDRGMDRGEVKKFGNVLINSLNAIHEHVVAEVIHVELQAGDRLLLCSDGLSDMVDADSIESILSVCEIDVVCDKLVKSALDGGGRDNITVVVCDLSFETEV